VRGFLLDTNVVSASSPLKLGAGDRTVADWMRESTDRLFLSVVSVGEIQAGIEKAGRKGAAAKAGHLSRWLALLVEFYGDRLLPIDVEVAKLSGVLFDVAASGGHAPGWADAQIAATARSHDLTLVTRNAKHFRAMGVDVLDPFVPGALL
jgi:toxin FitB